MACVPATETSVGKYATLRKKGSDNTQGRWLTMEASSHSRPSGPSSTVLACKRRFGPDRSFRMSGDKTFLAQQYVAVLETKLSWFAYISRALPRCGTPSRRVAVLPRDEPLGRAKSSCPNSRRRMGKPTRHLRPCERPFLSISRELPRPGLLFQSW